MVRYHAILQDFVRNYAVPSMQELGWSFKAAKSYGWKKARRGADFHVDQPLRTHILNGLFAVTRVLEYLQDQGYYQLSEKEYKKTLVLYAFHDAYKDSDVGETRTGAGEFGVSLEALEDLFARTNLRQFADVSATELRAASVSLLSPKVADLASASSGLSRLLTLVHLADALASQQTSRDFKTAENRVHDLSGDDAFFVLQQKRMSKRIDIDAIKVRPALKFYYHELDDYRGLSTLSIHQATEAALAPYGLYPILYFANGILYLGPEISEIDVHTLRRTIASTMFMKIRAEAGQGNYAVTEEACHYGQRLKFRKDVYLFSPLEQLLQVIQNYPLGKKATGFFTKVVKKRVAKEKYASVATTFEDFCQRFDIPVDADTDESFAQRWNAAHFMFMGIESIAEALLSEDVLAWMCLTFHTPPQIAAAVRQHRALLQTGGVADHCLVLSYHWLMATRFLKDARKAQEVEIVDIQHMLSQQAMRALKPHDSEKRRLDFVNEELSLQSDIEKYLDTNLLFSFHLERLMDDDRLASYEHERKRSAHKRTCIICNRDIPAKMKSSVILTDIASQQAQTFSNKLQPSQTVGAQMVWCPMCYLEFMLRKLGGQSYPADSDYNASYRLHLYVLPDYSFTPQLWEYTSQQLLKNVHPQETVVSKLVLRGSKDDPALPTRWLNQHSVDEEWLEQVRDMFAYQAAHMKTKMKDGKPRGKQGDRLTFSIKNPNYMLITYDNVVDTKSDKGLAPTHIEVWTKALYAATLIHLLTGARVYITDKPYLSIMSPEEMKTIIEMDGLHPLLSGILPVSRDVEVELLSGNNSRRLPLITLPAMLDLLAAVWEINAGLTQITSGQRRNLDKQVANILEEVKINYLAGATLYKMHERDKASPYPAFTHACQILLPQQADHIDEFRINMKSEGYELMLDQEGGYLMSLADRITTTSLELYHPRIGAKGRAHRFETLFRTGVDAMKNNASSSEDDEELISRVAGKVLKRLERIIDGGGFAPTYGAQRLETVHVFATLLVKDLFWHVCAGSVSKLTHEENHLADAIYFLTFQKVQQYWEERKKQKIAEADEVDANGADVNEELATSDL